MTAHAQTVAEAVNDPRTRLGAAAAQCAADCAKRIEAARKIAAEQGITLADALLQLWGV